MASLYGTPGSKTPGDAYPACTSCDSNPGRGRLGLGKRAVLPRAELVQRRRQRVPGLHVVRLGPRRGRLGLGKRAVLPRPESC